MTGPLKAPAAPRWGIVALLMAALFLNYIDRGLLSTAAPLMQDELGFSAEQLGWLLSAFFWSYALLQIPVGWLAEHFGAARVLGVALAVWACATMLTGTAHTLAALLLLRVLLGVGESAGFPGVSKTLATVVPVARLGHANGIVAFGYLFAPAVGTFVGGALMIKYGWRSAFFAFGALSLVWLLPWVGVRLPRPPPRGTAGGAPPFAALLRRRELWGTSLGHFSGNYMFYFMLTWLPLYLVRERGFSMEAMTHLAGWAYFVNAVSALVAGYLIDRVARSGRANLAYKTSMVSAHVGSVIGMLVMAFGAPAWALGAIFACQMLSGISSPGTFAIAQVLAGPNAAARWVGVQNACANLAGIIAPALTGILVQQTHHFTSALIVTAAVSLLGIVGWGLMVRRVQPLDWTRSTTPPGPLALAAGRGTD